MLAFLLSAVPFVATPCLGQATAPDSLYRLASPPSEFEWGCFAPCACPVMVQSPLTGSFLLRRSHVDPLYVYYDVLDVTWQVPGTGTVVTITGSGTYRLGGEVALLEELALDLSFDGGPSQHFDSGLVAPGAKYPAIHTSISLHGEFCHDSVLVVDAKPSAVAAVGEGGSRPPITASPNPLTSATEIGFTVPGDGPVRVSVFDVTGRRARTLVDRQWLPAGEYRRVWDGRLEGGPPAPPGLYLVRLEAAGERFTRTLVKLR